MTFVFVGPLQLQLQSQHILAVEVFIHLRPVRHGAGGSDIDKENVKR